MSRRVQRPRSMQKDHMYLSDSRSVVLKLTLCIALLAAFCVVAASTSQGQGDGGFLDDGYRSCPPSQLMAGPTSLNLSQPSPQQIEVTWQNDSAAGPWVAAQGGLLTWVVEGAGSSQVKQVPATATTVTFDNLLPSVDYDVRGATTVNDLVISWVVGRSLHSPVSQVPSQTVSVPFVGQNTQANVSALWDAIKMRNSVRALEVLQQVDVSNLRNANDKTVLHAAASGNMAAFVEELLKLPGANTEVRYTERNSAFPNSLHDATPLHSASVFNRKEVIDVLLAHGADANARTANGNTALHIVTSYNGTESIRALVAHGADINAKNDEGHTPLYGALTWYDDTLSVPVLLSYPNIEANSRDEQGLTVLHRAVSGEKGWLINALLRSPHVDPNRGDFDGWTPLHRVARRGLMDPARKLLGHRDIDPNEVGGKEDMGALHLAVNENDLDMVELLLDHRDTDPNLQMEGGFGALYLAVYLDHYDIAEALLDHRDTDPNLLNDYGWSAMGARFTNPNPDMIQLLTRHGGKMITP